MARICAIDKINKLRFDFFISNFRVLLSTFLFSARFFYSRMLLPRRLGRGEVGWYGVGSSAPPLPPPDKASIYFEAACRFGLRNKLLGGETLVCGRETDIQKDGEVDEQTRDGNTVDWDLHCLRLIRFVFQSLTRAPPPPAHLLNISLTSHLQCWSDGTIDQEAATKARLEGQSSNRHIFSFCRDPALWVESDQFNTVYRNFQVRIEVGVGVGVGVGGGVGVGVGVGVGIGIGIGVGVMVMVFCGLNTTSSTPSTASFRLRLRLGLGLVLVFGLGLVLVLGLRLGLG